jgi:hypothetical protein
MKLGGERLRVQEGVSKCLQVQSSGQPGYRGVRGPFIAPQGNLPVGVSEIQTCPGRGPVCTSRPSRYVSVINDNHLVSLMNFIATKVN